MGADSPIDSVMPPFPDPPPRFAVVGAGRLGTSLALALQQSGWRLIAWTARTPEGRERAQALLGSEPLPDASAVAREAMDREAALLLLTVPDDALPAVAAQVAAAMLADADGGPPLRLGVGHTSGASPLAVLASCAAAGTPTFAWHPLQTFSDPRTGPERLRGTWVAISAADEAGRDRAALLTEATGARSFALDDRHRALYHAAACVAGNYLLGLEHVAVDLLTRAGVPAEAASPALLPLIRGALANLEAQGPVAALTGPLSRGDEGTIARHLEALAQQAPEHLPLYRTLGLETLALVRARGAVGRPVLARLTTLLSAESTPIPTAGLAAGSQGGL